MKLKWAIVAVLAAFLGVVVNSSSVAVDTREVDRVRNKAVLDSTDFQIIDNFVAEAVRELVRTREFTSIARLRTVILSRQKSTQGQYAQKFSEAAHKYISEGFEQTRELEPEDRKTKIQINLLILTDGLQDLRLADLAIKMLKSKNMVIRYWAVHCLTNPAVIKQLNSEETSNSSSAEVIAEEFKQLIESSSSEILGLMAQFAADVKIPQGEELLLQIADMRIKRYADWTVKYELLDNAILKLLAGKIPSPPADASSTPPAPSSGKPAIARRFGQLFSYVIQRYVRGQPFLSDTQKQQLASVLVDTEDKCIGRLLGRSQPAIKRAVERSNLPGLLAEHDRLLGSATTPGQLPATLNFDYGTTPTGQNRTAPIPLPEPPTKPPK